MLDIDADPLRLKSVRRYDGLPMTALDVVDGIKAQLAEGRAA